VQLLSKEHKHSHSAQSETMARYAAALSIDDDQRFETPRLSARPSARSSYSSDSTPRTWHSAKSSDSGSMFDLDSARSRTSSGYWDCDSTDSPRGPQQQYQQQQLQQQHYAVQQHQAQYQQQQQHLQRAQQKRRRSIEAVSNSSKLPHSAAFSQQEVEDIFSFARYAHYSALLQL
jgi:hypothetical protein